MKAKSSEREERLAEALRANLKRRKTRIRTIEAAPPGHDQDPCPNKAENTGE